MKHQGISTKLSLLLNKDLQRDGKCLQPEEAKYPTQIFPAHCSF